MTTALQTAVVANLNKRQQTSLRTLQAKVEGHRGFTMRVSDAQMRAMQAAYNAAKASGLPLDAQVIACAAQLGLK